MKRSYFSNVAIYSYIVSFKAFPLFPSYHKVLIQLELSSVLVALRIEALLLLQLYCELFITCKSYILPSVTSLRVRDTLFEYLFDNIFIQTDTE